jgi:hypothetical protein
LDPDLNSVSAQDAPLSRSLVMTLLDASPLLGERRFGELLSRPKYTRRNGAVARVVTTARESAALTHKTSYALFYS